MPDEQEQQQEGEKEEKKEPSRLESLVNEGVDFFKKVLTIGAIASMPYTFSFLGPKYVELSQIYGYTVTAGRVTNNLMKSKPALEGALKESTISSALAIPVGGLMQGFNILEDRLSYNIGKPASKIVRAGTWVGAVQPAFTTVHSFLHGNKDYKKRIMTTWKYLAAPSVIIQMFIAPYSVPLAMLASGGLVFGFGYLQARHGEDGGSLKNLFNTINPLPYAKATYTAAQKLQKGFMMLATACSGQFMK